MPSNTANVRPLLGVRLNVMLGNGSVLGPFFAKPSLDAVRSKVGGNFKQNQNKKDSMKDTQYVRLLAISDSRNNNCVFAAGSPTNYDKMMVMARDVWQYNINMFFVHHDVKRCQ